MKCSFLRPPACQEVKMGCDANGVRCFQPTPPNAKLRTGMLLHPFCLHF